ERRRKSTDSRLRERIKASGRSRGRVSVGVRAVALAFRKKVKEGRGFVQRAQQRDDLLVRFEQLREIEIRARSRREVATTGSAIVGDQTVPGRDRVPRGRKAIALAPRSAQSQAQLEELSLELVALQKVISQRPACHA